jgi:hypothetical protein
MVIDPRIAVQIFYGLPLLIFIFQSTYVAKSFHSDVPLLFYLFVCVGLGSLSLVHRAFDKHRLSRWESTDSRDDKLPYCQTCSQQILARGFHCQRCGSCVQRQYGHVELTNTCLGHYSVMNVLMGLGTSIIYFLYILFDIICAIFRPDTLWSYLTSRILLICLLLPALYGLIQVSIFLTQYLYLVATNGIILESKKWLCFEYFVCQDPQRNPYDRGFLDNWGEVTGAGESAAWPCLTPGQVTDAYCEDFMKYRGVDLKPTIRDPAVENEAPNV